MKVISTNIGEPTTINWNGKDVQTGLFKTPNTLPIYLGTTDVKNDIVIDRVHHGGKDKACYLYSATHYSYWKEKYPDLDWSFGMFGENITIDGFDEYDIKIGNIYQIGKAIIQISEPRQPCFKLGVRFNTQKIIKDFLHSSYSGFYVRVLQEGEVKNGDELTLITPTNNLSIAEIYNLYIVKQEKLTIAKQALLISTLAESCKQSIKTKYKL